MINGLAKVFIIFEDDNTYKVCFRRENGDDIEVRTIDEKITDPDAAQRIKKAYMFGYYDGIDSCNANTLFKIEVIP